MNKAFIIITSLVFSLSLPANVNSAEPNFSLDSNIKTFEQTGSPFILVKQIGQQVFEAVKKAKQDQNGNVEQNMQLIIEQLLMPYVDVPFASYKVLGTQLKASTKEERQLFIEAMAKNLIDTYSKALAQYDNQTIIYESDKKLDNEKIVAVKTELLSDDRPAVDIIFKMRKNKKTEEWKAYDLIVEGISLVDSKRAELAKPLRVNGIRYVAENLLN